MEPRHISLLDERELESFLTENPENSRLSKLQAHYRECTECREWVRSCAANAQLVRRWDEEGERLPPNWHRLFETLGKAPSSEDKDEARMRILAGIKGAEELKAAVASRSKKNAPLLARPIGNIAAASSYTVGEDYASISLPIESPGGNFMIECRFSFYWTEEMWGHLSLKLQGDRTFSREQARSLLASLRITLYDAENRPLRRSLGVDRNGNFPISEKRQEIERIRECLCEKSLLCGIDVEAS